MPMIIRNNIRYAGGSGGSNGSSENIVELTQAEYDALGDVVNSDNITYYIIDADEQLDASSVAFDDTETQLGASDVQGAISKLNSSKANQNDVSNLNDTVNELNKNIQNKADSSTVNELSKNIEQCFQSVSDGKTLVASAITDKGVSTASDATFEVIANKVRSLEKLNFSKAYAVYATSDSTRIQTFPAIIGQTYIVAITGMLQSSVSANVSGAEVLEKKHVQSRPYDGFYRDLTVMKLKATSTTVTVGSNLLTAWNVICAIPC